MGRFMTGTRQSNGYNFEHSESRLQNGANTRDIGLDKLATASITFHTATNHLTAANGTFANFAVDDIVEVTGTQLNNGRRTVIGVDATNQAFLNVDFPPQAEGPVTATVRTA